jgi:biotin carboxyl carrier protein
MKLRVIIRSGSKTSEHVFEAAMSADKLRRGGLVQLFLDGKALQADWADIGSGQYSLLVDGRSYALSMRRNADIPNGRLWVSLKGSAFEVELQDPRNRRRGKFSAADQGPQEVLAPMPGRIVKILVAEGAHVHGGEGLLVVEAMKMQNEVRAARSGRVEKIHIAEGDGVEAGSRLVRLV